MATNQPSPGRLETEEMNFGIDRLVRGEVSLERSARIGLLTNRQEITRRGQLEWPASSRVAKLGRRHLLQDLLLIVVRIATQVGGGEIEHKRLRVGHCKSEVIADESYSAACHDELLLRVPGAG